MVDGRIAERRAEVRSARRRARLRRTLLGVALMLLVVGGAWLERSEHVAITDVTVEGVVRLDAAEVVEARGIVLG